MSDRKFAADDSEDDEIFHSDMDVELEGENDKSSDPEFESETKPSVPSSSNMPSSDENDEIYYESDEFSEDELLPPVSSENIIQGSRLRRRQ